MFAYLADNMAVGFSQFDCFPAIACWNRWDRPLNFIVSRRSRTIDARYAPGLAAEVKALHDSGRGRADWKDFDHSAPDWDRILAFGFPGMKARVNLEYFDYARSKYLALGMPDTMPPKIK